MLRFPFREYLTQKGSMITDTSTINLGHCVHAGMVMYMYLIFFMTGQIISNDGDKDMQVCISPTFIEPSVYQGMKVCHSSMLEYVCDTDTQNQKSLKTPSMSVMHQIVTNIQSMTLMYQILTITCKRYVRKVRGQVLFRSYKCPNLILLCINL